MPDLSPRTFTGAIVVLTGAASGMGEAMAHELAREGAHTLVLIDIAAERLSSVVDALGRQAPAVTIDPRVCDLSNREAVAALGAELATAYPRVDLLVNNAGISLVGRFDQMSMADMDAVLGVNLYAPIALTHALLPSLTQATGAHLINVSSLFGLIAPAGQTAYCTSKFGLRGFSESLAVELADQGVGVTTVHPGGISTRISTGGRRAAHVSDREWEGTQRLASKVLRMPPEKAAGIILAAARARRTRVLVGSDAKVAELIPRILPAQMRWFMRQGDRRLSRQRS